jgi:hypothetical protein
MQSYLLHGACAWVRVARAPDPRLQREDCSARASLADTMITKIWISTDRRQSAERRVRQITPRGSRYMTLLREDTCRIHCYRLVAGESLRPSCNQLAAARCGPSLDMATDREALGDPGHDEQVSATCRD